MAAKNRKNKPPETADFKVDWRPADQTPRYANHLWIQHTQHEFIVSFFELHPPLLTGSKEQLEQLQAERDDLGPALQRQRAFLADHLRAAERDGAYED